MINLASRLAQALVHLVTVLARGVKRPWQVKVAHSCQVRVFHDNLSTHRKEPSCFTTIRRFFCDHLRCGHLLERRHIFLCQFEVSLNGFVCMTFRIPAKKSKKINRKNEKKEKTQKIRKKETKIFFLKKKKMEKKNRDRSIN